jgi:hypothetical protein
MKECLTDEQLERFVVKEKRAWKAHLESCTRCAERLEVVRLNLELADEFKELYTDPT